MKLEERLKTERDREAGGAIAISRGQAEALEELLKVVRVCVADLDDGSAILYDYNEEALRAALTACDSIP